MKPLSLTVNGARIEGTVEARTSLADFLRGTGGLTGTHLGCEHGVCGACTIMVDGKPTRSCITYAVQMEGCDIRIIEGFDVDPVMEALRGEFNKLHALQCGFCTPGMLITSRDIVNRLGDPGEARVREELAGNLCRCTGYAGIVQAVRNVGAVIGPAKAQPAAAIPTAPSVARLPLRPATSDVPHYDAPAADMAGANTVQHEFVVNAPPEKVWAFFRDLPSVAACIPGAKLLTHSKSTFNALVGVKFGPMRASLTGAGTYAFDDNAKAGVIEGAGRDVLTGSLINGALKFAITEASPATTRVKTAMTFKLTGILAQFSRGTIAQQFVSRVMTQFADNASVALSGSGPYVSNWKLKSSLFALISRWLPRLK